jgi:DNA-binding transcriptional ArsR family regulator
VRVRNAAKTRKANGAGHRKPRANGDDPYLSRRRARREADDQALVEAMRRNSEATIGELATAVGKSRTSIVSGLHRLREGGLAESVEGKWKLTEEPAPRELPAKWTAPLSASQRAHAHA